MTKGRVIGGIRETGNKPNNPKYTYQNMKHQVHTLKYLKTHRQHLRRNMTPAETILWKCLKKKQLGAIIQRQHSIGNYIADFYCAQHKLVIELDGQPHFTIQGQKNDAIRTQYLQELGYTVLRFENKCVFEDLDGVLTTIKSYMGDSTVGS